MFSLKLENKSGNTLTFEQNSPFTISEIQGLNPPEATINTSEVALIDGAKYNSSKVNMRQINVAFAIEYQAAKNRIEIYKVLKSKQWIKLYYTGDYRDVFIEGYIQKIDITYFEMKQIVTCTILCPFPYFSQAQEMVNNLDKIVSAFHFPFASTVEPELLFSYIEELANVTIENYGDVACGMIIELYARNNISNPKIFNYVTGEFIGVNYSMETGDLITIDTRQGHKSITLLRDAVETNIFNSLMKNSTWLQLEENQNTFVFEVGTGNLTDLSITFSHYDLYQGV